MSSGYYEMIKKLEERIEQLERKASNTTESTPLWKHVLNQTNFYNGHGQLTIAEIKLSEVKTLLKDLEDNCNSLNDLFSLNLFLESDGSWSGNVYQFISSNEEKLWVSFDKVIIDTEGNDNV